MRDPPAISGAGESGQPGVLELSVEPSDGAFGDNADNPTVAPWGDLIVCEDGSGRQFLLGVTPQGELYKFTRNTLGDSEPHLSPDYRGRYSTARSRILQRRQTSP